MKIAFIAMSGVRAYDTELLEVGLTLPGFVERSRTIESLQLENQAVENAVGELTTLKNNLKEQLEWLEVWQQEERLPRAIRLDVLNNATGTRIIPPMVVPLRIDGDAGCINEEAGPCGF